MENPRPHYSIRSRACCIVLACLFSPLHAGEKGTSASSAKEQSARKVNVEEARELVTKGDASYESARYADALEAYAGALELLPATAESASFRAAVSQRHSQACVEQARTLSRKGDVAAALAIMEKALSLSPKDPDALDMQGELNDPIRTNPALTKAHAQNVDSVRRGLYTAEGAFNLGKYAQAKLEYEQVLRIDPTNSAARRGMEKLATTKSAYFSSAYDHTRAELLGQVEAGWELQVPPLVIDPGLTADSSGAIGGEAIPAANKIERIIIPSIALDQTTLSEAIDFLRIRAAENDTLETDPARKGVNFTVNLGAPDSATAKEIQSLRFDLRLTQVPLSQVIRYINDLTRTTYTTDDFSVIIAPVGSVTDSLVSRIYRVPPDFISSLTTESGGAATPGSGGDPFAAAPRAGGIIAARMGAREALEKQGVTFPEGAGVTYIASSNVLRVVNTPANQDYIAQVVQSIAQTEPMMISVRVTMIETEQNNLEELGYDWLLTPTGFGGGDFNISGGTPGNGTAIGDVPNSPAGGQAATSGLRSGDGAISGNAIDALLGTARGRQTSARAPGIFGLRSQIDDATINTLVRGLNLKKGTDVLAAPAITTRNGQSSSIVVAREFIYPTEYEPPELPTSTGRDTLIVTDQNGNVVGGSTPLQAVTPATPTAFEKRDTGVTLEVLPVADANKQTIDVTLSPQFVSFDGFVNFGSPINSIRNGPLGPSSTVLTENAILLPIFSKNAVTSSISVADGGTIVVGGLLTSRVQDVEDKVPVLSSIPIIGRLFQTKARETISKAVIFLVHVEILDPTGRPYRDR